MIKIIQKMSDENIFTISKFLSFIFLKSSATPGSLSISGSSDTNGSTNGSVTSPFLPFLPFFLPTRRKLMNNHQEIKPVFPSNSVFLSGDS